MRAFLVKLQYQGDDRCENNYSVYAEEPSEETIESRILELPIWEDLEQQCISDYCEYFEDDEDYDPDEQYADINVEDITDDKDLSESDWFRSLEVLIDERR